MLQETEALRFWLRCGEIYQLLALFFALLLHPQGMQDLFNATQKDQLESQDRTRRVIAGHGAL